MDKINEPVDKYDVIYLFKSLYESGKLTEDEYKRAVYKANTYNFT